MQRRRRADSILNDEVPIVDPDTMHCLESRSRHVDILILNESISRLHIEADDSTKRGEALMQDVTRHGAWVKVDDEQRIGWRLT